MMGKKPRIDHLVYELTEACNQNCRFCYNHWRPEGCLPADKRLARRTLGRILRDAEIGSVSFSGGEPTLLENIQDLVLKCRLKGTSVNVLTNGTLISEEDLKNFSSLGVGAVQIPLLSDDPSVHEHLTGLPGSWKKTLDSIKNVIKTMGPEHFAAVLVITSVNAGTLEGTLELLDSLGVMTVMVNRFNLGGNGLRNREELSLTREGLKAAFAAVSRFACAHPGMRFVSGVCTPVCVLDPLDYPGIAFTSCTTDISKRPITISYKGDVRFCNHSPFVMGNLWKRNLKEILEAEEIMSRYSAVPEQCAGCKLFSRCKGGCRAASEQVYGTFDRIDPIIESL